MGIKSTAHFEPNYFLQKSMIFKIYAKRKWNWPKISPDCANWYTSTLFQQLTILSYLSVLIVAVVYRRVRIRQESCDQFSDVTSTSSRSSASTCSTISSTRSTKSVPDRMNIISFNAEGNLRKQVCYYNWFNWPGAIWSCFRPTTVTTSTVWIVTTSWAVWRIFQYKCESY